MGETRKLRRAFNTKYRNASLKEVVRQAVVISRHWNWPLPDSERQIEAEIVEYHRDGQRPLFHGGIRGLSVGEQLLPGTVTGMMNPRGFDNPEWKACRVYATPALSVAEQYAEYIGGTVYRVVLDGTIGLDIMDVRALILVRGSPQFKRLQQHPLIGEKPFGHLSQAMHLTLTGDSGTILEVLSRPVMDREQDGPSEQLAGARTGQGGRA